MVSPSEPTEIVRMLSSYKSEFRSSISASSLANYDRERPGKRPLATRLAFDDTLNETVVSNKHPRLTSDPFDTLAGRRRFASENTSGLQKENAESQARIRELEAQLAGAVSKAATADTRANQAELNLAAERLEWDRKMQKATRMYRSEKEKSEELSQQLNRMKSREEDRQDQRDLERRRSVDTAAQLEAKNIKLREAKEKLEERVDELKQKLANRPDIDKMAYRSQVQGLQAQVRQLTGQLEEKELRLTTLHARLQEANKDRTLLAETKEDLGRVNCTVERLKAELEANRDAVLQRKAMQDKLASFCELQEENKVLRRRNDLLQGTQENIALLKEQIRNLTADRERAEQRSRDRDMLEAKLQATREELKEWSKLLAGLAPADQQAQLADLGVETARGVVAINQNATLQLSQKNSHLQAEVNELKRRCEELGGESTVLSRELARVKEEQAEQTRLVKKLQRKLQLLTMERNGYKDILDSYEKELTISGSQMDKERVAALEKNLEAFRSMVEVLEAKNEALAAVQRQSSSITAQAAPAESSTATTEWRLKYEKAAARLEQLELEAERQQVRGSYNPLDTRVIHFKHNPIRAAIEREEIHVAEVKKENEALKARVKLLEEGQTKDLTIMVGHKLEEEASSQEVADLRESLKKAEVKTQRVMEAFKTTSTEFREFVCALTGYRIDGLANRNYKVKPLLAQSPEDYLLFHRTEQGEVQMLESDFSLELGELMEVHLEQHNSIPMFMAALIIDLFSKSFDTGPDEEEAIDMEGYEDNEASEAEETVQGEVMQEEEQHQDAEDVIVNVDDD